MKAAKPRYFQLLELLSRHKVEFIVVGGVAAILEGAPITTLDLDIVYNRAPENLSRLLDMLREVEAQYRDPAGRTILPDLDKLATITVNLFRTNLGPFDALVSVAESNYQELLDTTRVVTVDDLEVRILTLAKIIEAKELADRDKDRAMLPVLRKTLEVKEEN